jgi:hypothetical protein
MTSSRGEMSARKALVISALILIASLLVYYVGSRL